MTYYGSGLQSKVVTFVATRRGTEMNILKNWSSHKDENQATFYENLDWFVSVEDDLRTCCHLTDCFDI